MTAQNTFDSALSRAARHVEVYLGATLPPKDNKISDAMHYAVLNGGKRLRAFLVLEGATLHGVDSIRADPAAAAIECMHAYSLVHDDLPCMDDDDLRRGKPTVHIKWDQATAVLAGDALQTQAFAYLAGIPDVPVSLITALASASGVLGMVGGQALDIAAETAAAPLTLDEITALQARKTGALISWAAQAGAILAGADTAPLQTYAESLGLAFQIQDDILDIEGDVQTTGKRLRKDADAGKATFVSYLGLIGAKTRAAELVDLACDALDQYGEQAENLRQAARYSITRAK